MNRYLLIDGNNLVHAASASKKLTVGETEVQGIYVFIRMLRTAIGKYPMCKPVVLWDGASWRYMNFPEYKGNRDKSDTPSTKKQAEDRVSAKKQIPAIMKAVTLLGVDQVRASNMEGDDLAAIMGDRYAARGDKIVLCSGDKDWIQLAGGNVLWYDPIKDRKVRTPEDIETAIKVKVKSFEQFVEFKALCGDIGDNVPGVGGVGEKGAQDFLEMFGSFTAFTNGCLDGTIDPTTLPKKFRDLAEDEDKQIAFSRNIWLMDLRTSKRPAPVNLTVTHGEPDLARFETFCRRLMFQSFLTDLPLWASVFPAFRLEEAA
ncbi:hypothetical protein NKH72_22075 [Mesorhizobium sp. M0955]|uniref:5'-3' exonuclease H3TH domain-containing protein n=1 Tax=Mesorhizobium sp. M0955 TaxID=2957033 RepID=UPI00333A9AEA